MYGPDVAFDDYTIPDLHDYLEDSGIVMESVISRHSSPFKPSFAQTHSAQVLVPQANAAYESQGPDISSVETQGPNIDVPVITPQANAAAMAMHNNPTIHNRNRHVTCPVCFQRHPVLHCWARGKDFQPLWLQRNVVKYNALHPKDAVEDVYKTQAPPLRYANVQSAQASKSVSFQPSAINDGNTNQPSDELSLSGTHLSLRTNIPMESTQETASLPEFNESVISPQCHMARDAPESMHQDDTSFIEV